MRRIRADGAEAVELLLSRRHLTRLHADGGRPGLSRYAYAGAEADTRARHLETAIASRAVIEQAKGMFMAEHRCSADEAFALLVKISQQTHRKLSDVAQQVVDRRGRL